MLFWSTQTNPLLELSPLCPQWHKAVRYHPKPHSNNPTPTTPNHPNQTPAWLPSLWRRNTLNRSHHTKVNNLQSPFCIGRGTCHVRILQRMSYLKKEYTEQIKPHQSEQSSKSLLYRARHLPCEDPSKNVLLEEGIHWTDQTTPKWTIFKVPSVLGEAPAMSGSCKRMFYLVISRKRTQKSTGFCSSIIIPMIL